MPAPPACLICGRPTSAARAHHGLALRRCRRCRIEHQVAPADPGARYRGDYFRFWGDETDTVSRQKRLSARWLLERLERVRPPGRLLEVGCAGGDLLVAARARGWDVAGVEPNGPMAARAGQALGPARVVEGTFPEAAPPGPFDAVVMNDVLEHLPDLPGALAAARDRLAPGGVLAVNTPDLDSLSAWVMGPRWMHYKEEHLHYLSRGSLRALLERAGLTVVALENAWKAISLGYVGEHFRVYGSVPGSSLVARALLALPRPLRDAPLPLLTGNLLCLARR